MSSFALGALATGADLTEISLQTQGGLAAARSELFDALDDGAFLVNYLGHGGLDRLAAEGLLTTADVPSLDNGDRLPILTSLTCSVGRFELPGFESLAEALTLAEDRGAIAVWAPTGTSYNHAAEALGSEFFVEVFQNGQARLGDAVVEALRSYAATGEIATLVEIYTLIGDPALRLD